MAWAGRVRRYEGALILGGALLLVAPAAAVGVTLKGKPDRVFTVVVLSYDYTRAPYCTALLTRGTHHATKFKPGQVIVGFDNFYDPGSDPFPCWEKIDHAYRGYVRFPGLRQFYNKATRGAAFTNAYLRFRVVAGSRRSSTVAYERGYWSAVRRLGIVRTGWSTTGEDGRHAQRSGFHKASLYNTLATRNYPVVTRLKINVSDILEEWVCGSEKNYGFLLMGPNEYFGRNNDAFVSRYQNFELLVEGVGTRKPRRCV